MTKIRPETYEVFRTASITYFTSSLFFPKDIKTDVFILYAFVRQADNYVDSPNSQSLPLRKFVNDYHDHLGGKSIKNQAIIDFVALQRRKNFQQSWIEAFLKAMLSDLDHHPCRTLQDSKDYMYGSAEVIGLMMAQIMNLPAQSHQTARLLGRAMQYANFIRDIAEDVTLGRNYFPATDMRTFKLSDLKKETTSNNKKNFKQFLKKQIKRYYTWQEQAEQGYAFIPWRSRVAVKTAADMYKWTIKQIEKDPMIVYRRKVKPHKYQVMLQAVRNLL